MRVVKLSSGEDVKVDDEDYAKVSRMAWHAIRGPKQVYAAHDRRENGERYFVYMHRLVIGAKLGEFVDHKNHDGLDNQKENLRLCTSSQNQQNRRKLITTQSSSYLGVHWWNFVKAWCVTMKVNDEKLYVGQFREELDAALARDLFVLRHYGEFALLNFPEAKQAEREEAYARRVSRKSRVGFVGVTDYTTSAGNVFYMIQVYDKLNQETVAQYGFRTAEEAARARDALALKIQGAKARLNFPQESS